MEVELEVEAVLLELRVDVDVSTRGGGVVSWGSSCWGY